MLYFRAQQAADKQTRTWETNTKQRNPASALEGRRLFSDDAESDGHGHYKELH